MVSVFCNISRNKVYSWKHIKHENICLVLKLVYDWHITARELAKCYVCEMPNPTIRDISQMYDSHMKCVVTNSVPVSIYTTVLFRNRGDVKKFIQLKVTYLFAGKFEIYRSIYMYTKSCVRAPEFDRSVFELLQSYANIIPWGIVREVEF